MLDKQSCTKFHDDTVNIILCEILRVCLLLSYGKGTRIMDNDNCFIFGKKLERLNVLNCIPHFRSPAIWLVKSGVVILAIPVKKHKMPKPVNSNLKTDLGHFSRDYWLVRAFYVYACNFNGKDFSTQTWVVREQTPY